MSLSVLITLTTAGADTANFSLFSDADGYAVAFETGISKAALLSGYTSNVVPDAATIIRVASTGLCTNYVDVAITGFTTTTTTTTSTTHRQLLPQLLLVPQLHRQLLPQLLLVPQQPHPLILLMMLSCLLILLRTIYL